LRKISKELGELTDDSFLQEMIGRGDTNEDGLISE
jgi:Ca2+-binding EF-hand superfamily protein